MLWLISPPHVPSQPDRLPVKGNVVDVLADDGFDHEVVGQRSLFNDGGGHRGGTHPQFLAAGAGALFTLGDLHVHDHRLDGDPLAAFVADELFGVPALGAGALGDWQRDDAFLTREVFGKGSAHRFAAELIFVFTSGRQGGVPRGGGGFAGDFLGAHAGFQLQKVELFRAEAFGAGAVLFEQHKPQPLLEEGMALVLPEDVLLELGDLQKSGRQLLGKLFRTGAWSGVVQGGLNVTEAIAVEQAT